MKASTIFKRFGAYVVDMFIITIICSLFTLVKFINPSYDKYIKASEEYNEVIASFRDEDIDAKEFNEKVRDLEYSLNKNGCIYIGIEIVVIFLYFGLFAYYRKGQTLGKQLFSLQIISSNDKELQLYNYFIRVFILYGIIPSILRLIGVCFNHNIYNTVSLASSYIDTFLGLVIALMILFTKDGRGLHDKLAGTKVIDLKLKETE